MGKHLCRALLLSGRNVIGIDQKQEMPSEAFTDVGATGFKYVAGDIRDRDLMKMVFRDLDAPDVVHLAANINLHGEERPSSGTEMFGFLQTNTTATWSLCEQTADAAGRRLIFASTRSVFGKRSPGKGPIREDDQYEPVGLYGDSKLAAELGVLAFRRELEADFVVARVTGGYGLWQDTAYQNIIRMVRAAASGQRYTLDSGADHQFEFTYVKDLIRGLMALLDATEIPAPVYHLSSGEMTSLGTVAGHLRQVVPGCQIELGSGSLDVESELERTPMAVDRIAADLGFRPAWGLRRSLADYVHALKSGTYGGEACD
jgi:UDP-glucose 4-epimerase